MKLARSVPLPSPIIYAAAYLLGGSSATTVVGTWTAVSDGTFTISIDGTEYDVTGVDFSSGVSDMDDVASKIQTALRAATGGSEIVVWDTDHFVIQSSNETSTSAVSVTSAEGTGTDISGAGTAFMDCETAVGTPVAALLGYQTLTTSFATLGVPFSIAHAGKLSLKMRQKATSSGEKISFVLETSDDDIEKSEASSRWHPAGAQAAGGGSPNLILEEDYQYDYTSTSSTERGITPLRYEDVAKKARVRVKCDKPVGRARATCGLVEH